MAEITVEELKSLIRYEPETGKLYWLHRPGKVGNWNAKYAGKEAFTAESGGYRVGAIFGKNHYAHRVAWAIFHGCKPAVIDHINGDRSDNRISNLRSVSAFENARNSARKSSNRSGHTGVSWCSAVNKWRATIQLDGKAKHLGVFQRMEDAIAARLEAQSGIFHENHGRSQ